MDCSPPDSPVQGISQARILDPWADINHETGAVLASWEGKPHTHRAMNGEQPCWLNPYRTRSVRWVPQGLPKAPCQEVTIESHTDECPWETLQGLHLLCPSFLLLRFCKPLVFSHLYSFAFSQMSYKWNWTVDSFLYFFHLAIHLRFIHVFDISFIF